MLAWGAASTVVGTALLLDPVWAVATLLLPIAVLWVVGGLLDLGTAALRHGRWRWAWHLVRGVTQLMAASLVFGVPALIGRPVPLAGQYLLLAMAALFMGVADIGHAFHAAGQTGGTGRLVIGLAQMTIGLLLMANPVITFATLVTALAVQAVVAGAVMVVLGLSRWLARYAPLP